MRSLWIMSGVATVIAVAALLIGATALYVESPDADIEDDRFPLKDRGEFTVGFLDDALEMYDEEGRQATVDYYNTPESTFGEWYVVIFDESDKIIAHANPDLLGEDLKGDIGVDSTGYRFGDSILAGSSQGHWVDYIFANPVTGNQEYKHTWVVHHDGLIFAAGWYQVLPNFSTIEISPIDEAQSSSSSSGEDAGHSSSSDSDSSSAADSASDSGSSSSDDSDDVVAFTNPGGEDVLLDTSVNATLANSQPLGVITWTVGPAVSPGELVAEGIVQGGTRLFEPINGESSAFSIYFKDYDEVLLELLPDLGPMHIWQTDATVAETDWEVEGNNFKIRAYSPLLMDIDTSLYELRVFGYDAAGQPALLAVAEIGYE